MPRCEEWGDVWLPADEDRWHAHLTTDDELVFYCQIAPSASSARNAMGGWFTPSESVGTVARLRKKSRFHA
jgi:hypothetical protein